MTLIGPAWVVRYGKLISGFRKCRLSTGCDTRIRVCRFGSPLALHSIGLGSNNYGAASAIGERGEIAKLVIARMSEVESGRRETSILRMRSSTSRCRVQTIPLLSLSAMTMWRSKPQGPSSHCTNDERLENEADNVGQLFMTSGCVPLSFAEDAAVFPVVGVNLSRPVAGDTKIKEFEKVATLPVNRPLCTSNSISWNCSRPILVTSPVMPETCTRSPILIPRLPSRTSDPRLARMTFCRARSSPALRSPKYVANELKSEATLNKATTAMANHVRRRWIKLTTRLRFRS